MIAQLLDINNLLIESLFTFLIKIIIDQLLQLLMVLSLDKEKLFMHASSEI